MVDKLDFVIHCIQGAYEDKESLGYEDTSRGNTDGDPTPREQHLQDDSSLCLYQTQLPDLQLYDFEWDLQALDD